MPARRLHLAPARVPMARPAAVNDRELTTLRQLGHDARHGNVTEAEAEWVLSVAGPLLDELALRRAWMRENAATADLGNVIVLPAGRP